MVCFTNYFEDKLFVVKTKKVTLAKRTPTVSQSTKKVIYTGTSGGSQIVTFTDVNKVHPALKEYFCYCLFKVSNRIKSVLEEAILPFEIHGVHFAILTILLEGGDTPSQNELGEQMGIDKASMVKLIDHLEKKKLIARVSDSIDRRCKLLHLTPHGKSVITKAGAAACAAEKKFMSTLSADDQKVVKKIIPQLLQD